MKIQKNPVTLEGALTGAPAHRLWLRHMKNHWHVYVIGGISVFATDITEVMVPKIIQWVIEALTKSEGSYTRLIWGLVGILALQFLGRIFWRQTLGQQTHFVAARLKSSLWDRSRYFPRKRLESDLSPGELMNVATGDVGVARTIFGFSWVGTLDFIALITMTITSMALIDAKLTLILVGFTVVLPIFLSRLSKLESQQHQIAQEHLSNLTDLAAQSVSTAKLQRITRTGQFWFRRLLQAASDYRKKRLDVVYTSIDFIPYTGIAPLISFALLVYFGAPKVISGQLSVGAFVALQTYIFMIQIPLIELGTLISEWQRGFSSLKRVTATLSEKETPGLRSGGIETKPKEIVFQAQNLSFQFKDSRSPLFANLNFELRSGDRWGISGPIGTGKSTLLQILSGFETHFTGDLKLFGREIKEYSHSSLRQLISIVPQKPFLFADSIRNNLLMNRSYGDEEIWFFLELAGLKEDVSQFPQKLDTRLGEWGVNLSGGQKQRMTLARALASKPQILLLDDCLSAVDTVTEEKILKNLDQHLANTTLVWIAHRESTLRYCNQKLHLQNTDRKNIEGQIV